MGNFISAIDPTKGNNFSEQYGPLIVLGVTVIIALGCAFGLIPGGDLATALGILGGGAAGHYIRSQA